MNIRDNQLCAFGWLAHWRNSRLRPFTEDTQFSSLRLARDPGAIRTEHLGFGSSGLRIKIGVAELAQGSLDERLPVRAKSLLRGWWSRPDTCQDYFFSVSQQDIDRLEASIREQTNPLHHREPIPDVILIVRRIAEEAIIVAH
jgi:hypothetical protein